MGWDGCCCWTRAKNELVVRDTLPSPKLEADSGLDCSRFVEVRTVYWTTVKQDNEGATGTDLELRDDEKESVEPK